MTVGTAGHIDHGKTALVRALTGTATDRLPEERARGITIVLGFAQLPLVDGRTCSLIDVPGHERFVRTMIAGASGIDLALVVVAADEGVMPQTREHLDILELLGVQDWVVAVTKCDLVDDELAELAGMEIAEEIEARGRPEPPVLLTSAHTGRGIEELRAVLTERLAQRGQDRPERPFRLPVDRCFLRTGFGVVVTGTAISGAVQPGDELELLPGGTRVRVRGVQVHGEAREVGRQGERVALNLGGVRKEQVGAGSQLVAPGSAVVSDMADLSITLLPDLPRPVRDGQEMRLLLGTDEVPMRLRLLEEREVDAGWSGVVQLRLKRPTAMRAGDRAVLRAESPVLTLGGGVILDPKPPRFRRKEAAAHVALLEVLAGDRAPAPRVVAMLQRSGQEPLEEAQLAHRLGLGRPALSAVLARLLDEGEVLRVRGEPARWMARAPAQRLGDAIEAEVKRVLTERPLADGAAQESVRSSLRPAPERPVFQAVVEWLGCRDRMVSSGSLLHPPGHRPQISTAQEGWMEALRQDLEEAAFHPPDPRLRAVELGVPEEQVDDLLALLLRRRALERVRDDFLMGRLAFEKLIRAVAARVELDGELSPAAFKELSGLSRRHAIPLLEHLDRVHVTVRQGNRRRLHARWEEALTGASDP